MSGYTDVIEIKRDNDVREYPLTKRTIQIGRSTENEIVLEDEYVSRKHAKLEYRNNVLYITDLNGKNGTKVNGLKLEPYKSHQLKDNDTIAIGSFNLTLRSQRTVIATPPPDKTANSDWLKKVGVAAIAILVIAAATIVGIYIVPKITSPVSQNTTIVATPTPDSQNATVAVTPTPVTPSPTPTPTPTPTPIQTPTPTPEPQTIATAAAKVKPAVVYIYSPASPGSSTIYYGSGVIVDKSGYILTANHVVANVSTCKVKIFDSGEFDGKIITRDVTRDMAIIKIDPSGFTLPTASLGNSDEVKIGDEIVLIGYPQSQYLPGGASISRGIISAIRSVSELRLLQTDAAVNPGNSGGPMVNLRGEIIGIVSVKLYGLTSERQIEGIGFAVPTNDIKELLSRIDK